MIFDWLRRLVSDEVRRLDVGYREDYLKAEREHNERVRQFEQERISSLNEQVRILSDALAEWRRLYNKQFDMLHTEVRHLNGWVATVSASHNLDLPANADFDPEASMDDLDEVAAARRDGLDDDDDEGGWNEEDMNLTDILANIAEQPDDAEDVDTTEL